MIYITMYLAAIILANLSSAHFGASASIFNAFLFIGLDLTARDKLHEAWRKNGLIWKMGLLIAVGSAFSYLINRNAGMIAVASFVAFASAALVDTLIYQLLHEHSYMVKVNGSNVFSALVDSLVFPTIAFGGFLPLITLGQFIAKVAGGAIWAYLLRKTNSNVSILVKIKYWAAKLWILRKLGIVYDPDERGNRLEAMVDRMAGTIVDKDAEIYALKEQIASLKAMITRNA